MLVGVGVIVIRDGRVLLGKRQGSHGAETWALPGGHLEYGESIAECAQREVLEETGLRLHTIEPAPYTSTVFAEIGKHYITLFVTARSDEGEARVCEPDKCSEWAWFAWSALPSPLFAPLATLYETGFTPSGPA